MERTVSWRPLIRHKSGATRRGQLNCQCDCAPPRSVAEKPHSFEIECALNLKPKRAQFLASSGTRIRQRFLYHFVRQLVCLKGGFDDSNLARTNHSP